VIGIAPIVEGHGEFESVRILVERIWQDLAREDWPLVLPPIRQPRGRLCRRRDLLRAVDLAVLKLRAKSVDCGVVLLLLDADEDCPGELGPRLARFMRDARPDVWTGGCVANVEYETWFVASADRMGDLLRPEEGEDLTDPEGARRGKRWVRRRIRDGVYRETVDQPRLTSRIDVRLCRARSPSFDKLCREIEVAVAWCEGGGGHG